MRGPPKSILLIVMSLLLITGCATIRPGDDGFRVITEGYESQLPGERLSDTMKRADTHAQKQMGVYVENHPETRKKFAGLLGLPFDHPDVIMYASRAGIIKRKPRKIIAGVRTPYSYAAIPLVAPNAYVSGGLSLLFPGLGQIYMKRGGIGHILLGTIGAGLTIYNYMEYDKWHRKYERENKRDLMDEYYDTANTWFHYTQVSLAAYGIVTIFSTVQAFTLARSNQYILDTIRSGGVRTSSNTRLIITPATESFTISFYYGF